MSDDDECFGIYSKRNSKVARLIFRSENMFFDGPDYCIGHLDIIQDARNVLNGESLARGEPWWDCTEAMVHADLEERLADGEKWRTRETAALPHHREAMCEARRLLTEMAWNEARAKKRKSARRVSEPDFWDTAGV
ncbi:MAG: hypothetical protein CFE31_00520 [Rhizobiales bacterium PAR1]|nr:MAG: hypothetical protein CFE31_00520 [Rhizobiales bacterium PAR1]